MIFLGQASNYTFGQVLRQIFAHGNSRDVLALKNALAKRYRVERRQSDGLVAEDWESVELYHTGRSALAAAVQAVAPKGSRVIIPGLTCIAVVRAVRTAGCEAEYVDIDPETLQYDFVALEQKLKASSDSPVSAIIVQNTLGITIDMARVEQLAKKYQVEIIEDLAHSAGRFYPDGREVGTVGAATALSFGKGKAIDTIAGGALVLRSAKLARPLPPLFRAKRSARWRERWYPALGASIRCGHHLGLGKVLTAIYLKLHWIERSADAELNLDTKLEPWQAKRALQQLQHLPKTPLREHYLVHDRSELLGKLAEQGYYLNEIWYDTPVSPERYLDEANFPNADCPETLWVAKSIINLPTWYPAAKLDPVRKLIQPYIVEDKHDGK